MASVNKRRWKKPDGSTGEAWVLRYVDGKGVRRSKTCDTKKEADRARVKVESEIAAGTLLNGEATIRAVCDDYMKHVDMKMRDGRIGRSRYIGLEISFRKHVIPAIGNVPAGELTARQVEAFYTDMVRKRGLSVRTAKDKIYDLQLVETFARKHRLMNGKPVTEALVDLRGTQSEKVSTFMATQIADLLAKAASKRPNVKERSARLMECAVHLAAFSGLRFGEIMALTLSTNRREAGVDLDAGIVRVRHSLTFDDTLKGPKTRAGVRDVPLPAHVGELLRVWLRDHAVREPRGLIFRTPKATQLTGANFHLVWKKLLRDAGLLVPGDTFHFHALRHFCASWMIENGMPVTDVAALLGHSKFDMTLQVYAHPVVAPAARASAIERMVQAMPIAAPVTHGALSHCN